MQLNTPVDFPLLPFNFNHHQRFCFIGSCFAENISQKFIDHKFNTLSNPFGVLYNPVSLCNCLNELSAQHFDESRMIEHDGLWHSFSHHGSFSLPNKEQVIQNIKTTIKEGHVWLKTCDILFLTLGTASVFEYNKQVVSNCHKLPAKAFERRRLTVSEIVSTFSESLKRLKQLNPELKIIFTVSPVRYTKDGLYDNSLNKASLHLALEELVAKDSNYFYLPSYELIIDELRDYRYFAEDMTHPSPLAIDYLWDRLTTSYFSPQTIQLNKQVTKLIKAYHHRPLNTKPEAHRQFKEAMLRKASDLQKQHPELNLAREIEYFSIK